MTNSQLKNWIIENKEEITNRVNEYTKSCNIKISEFSDEQKHRLTLSLFAIEITKMVK